MKLATKFASAAATLVAFILLGTGLFLYLSEKNHLEAQQRLDQEASLQKFVKVCSESLLSNNDIVLINYVQTLKERPEVGFAALLDPQGHILVHNDPLQIGKTYSGSQNRPGTLLLASPVSVGTRRLGTALLGYDRRRLHQMIADILELDMRRFAAIAGMMMCLGLVLSVVLARAVTRPIKALSRGVKKIGEGYLNERIQVAQHDEIGELAAGFNEMAEKLSQLDRLKDEFVASVSHDLRNPLAAISGYVDALLEGVYGPVASGQVKALEYIILSAKSLGLMVNNVLDWAKIKAGRMTISKHPVDVHDLIEREAALYRAVAQRNSVIIEYRPETAEHTVSGDGESIERILNNLISNAVKFTPEKGAITIRLKRSGQDWLQIDVHNTGAGIRREDIPKLFQRFERLEEQAQKAKGVVGSGLGLTLVKQLVELHGGKVWASSEPGQGATFSFTLPLALQPAPSASGERK